MKKKKLILVAGVMYFLAMFGTSIESYAYRDIWYDFDGSIICAGSGGNCLPPIVVRPL